VPALSRIVATVGAVIAAVWLSPIAIAQGAPPRTVLTIHTGSEDFPGSSVLDGAMREGLQSRADAPVNYYAEYLEFDGRRIDVVVADTTPAVQFVIRFREELFPRVLSSRVVWRAASLRQILEMTRRQDTP